MRRSRIFGPAFLLFGGAALLAAQTQFSTTPVASYWMRVYPIGAFGEIWRLGLQVKDLKKTLPKVTAALEKGGATPSQPLENMAGSEKHGFQQLSYVVPAGSAAKLLASLQKLGELEELQKNPGIHPGVMEEVPAKLARLKAEAGPKAEKLAQTPAVREAIGEILAHLEAVDEATRAASSRVLLNIQLRQAAKAK